MAGSDTHDTHRVEIEYPADLLNEMSDQQVQRLAREAFYVRLYEQGRISSGRAGALLGMTRSDFLDLLSTYGVSYLDESADLSEDLHNVRQAGS